MERLLIEVMNSIKIIVWFFAFMLCFAMVVLPVVSLWAYLYFKEINVFKSLHWMWFIPVYFLYLSIVLAVARMYLL